MTVYTCYQLACDHPDCFSAYDSDVREVGSLAATRAGAKAYGWTRPLVDGRREDRCPRHREVPAVPSPVASGAGRPASPGYGDVRYIRERRTGKGGQL